MGGTTTFTSIPAPMNRQRLKHEAETVGAGSSVTRCLLDELHPGGQTEFGVDMGGWVCTVRGETKSGKNLRDRGAGGRDCGATDLEADTSYRQAQLRDVVRNLSR